MSTLAAAVTPLVFAAFVAAAVAATADVAAAAFAVVVVVVPATAEVLASVAVIVFIAELNVLRFSDHTYVEAPAFHAVWNVVIINVSHAGFTSGITI